jgi:hypothetical protein
MEKNKKSKQIHLILEQLKREGNTLFIEQIESYGQLRGFQKPISLLVQDELDGGEVRQLNAIETNTYRVPR